MVDKIRSHRSASRRWLWQGSHSLPLNLLLSFARRCRPNASKATQTSQPAVSGVGTNETTTWHMCSAGSKAGWLMDLIEGTNDDDDDGDKATERKNRFQCCDFPPLVRQFVHHRRRNLSLPLLPPLTRRRERDTTSRRCGESKKERQHHGRQ